MPSPFPGMDPFIESQDWEGFHASLIPALREVLIPSLRPAYVCDIQKYVFLLTDEEEIRRHIGPDVHIAPSPSSPALHDAGQVSTLEPEVLTLPIPVELENTYLTIRKRDGREVVAVIELLSPWNKARADGRSEYLQKRLESLQSSAHLVEIDLLRGGTRLPCREPLPQGDYFAYVSRGDQRPRVEVYAWSMSDQLPVIPVPLKPEDGDVPLNLQQAFDRIYEPSGYDYTLDYSKPLETGVTEEQAVWIHERLAFHQQQAN